MFIFSGFVVWENINMYLYFFSFIDVGPLLLTWFNLDPSMDTSLNAKLGVGWITYPFPNFNGRTDEV